MVSPFYILAIGLGFGFLLSLTGSKMKSLNAALITLALALFTAITGHWACLSVMGEMQQTAIFSAGFNPPFAISLSVGFNEAIIAFLVNIIGLFSVIYLWKKITTDASKLGIVLLILFMGLNMLVLTRDIFNMFVFLEITAISLSGLILIDDSDKAHASGFKYLLASTFISSIYLLGVVFVYFTSGTLFLDELTGFAGTGVTMASMAVFMVIIAIVLELKPFPANGWALDVYQGAHSAIGTIVSGAITTTMLFVLYKLIAMGNDQMLFMLTIIGAITFLFSNWLGLSQTNPNRLLGYSSIGQVGLVIAIFGLKPILGDYTLTIAFGVLLTHLLAKSGLFWLSGIIEGEKLEHWTILRNRPFLMTMFGIFIFALSAFPPFPSFYAKWQLVLSLASAQNYLLIGIILMGSMFEAIYLFRWFGIVVKQETTETPKPTEWHLNKVIPIVVFAAALIGFGYFTPSYMQPANVINYIPLLAVVALWILDFLPAWIKNTLLIGASSTYGLIVVPTLTGFPFIFGILFSAGAVITLLYGYSIKGKRKGFYPLTAMMFAGLMMLVQSTDLFSFFLAWEIMTAGSYFLILRGKKSQPHALSYMLFSFGGAMLILAGFAIAHAQTGSYTFESLKLLATMPLAPIVFIILTLGFLTKTAAIGLHIWLPGAHAEAEADVSPMVSAILLKAGVFGLVILFMNMGRQYLFGVDLMVALSWLAVITAIGANIMAAMQEDMKRLLAYSSVGQLGYILFGLSLMSHLGWLLAISGVIMHFMFKTMLFQAVGGVYSRTHDRMMYRMGGLIYQMPITFFVVLIGIIAMSGVPPLTGFSGKWISFNAVLEQGYYLQGAGMVLAGAVAFLYLFRLIHVPFLGQLKDNLRRVKEANFWILLPQLLIVVAVMLFSFLPGMLLERIGASINQVFPTGGLNWVESALPFGAKTAFSPYGYWNGTYVMIISMGVFVIILGIQWLMQRNNKLVKQFNIVYSAERPSTPETTHHGWNFYAHYSKSLGFLVTPWATRFWNAVSELVHDLSDKFRQIYNGNGQTYLIHILAFFLICFYFIYGGL